MTKIMLVEDDKNLREIYGVRLLAEGYDIVSAGDGEQALVTAIRERPQLIISDVMMPKFSGFDLLDILRQTDETKNIKVIMMTALSSEEQRQRGMQLGADRYLVKSQVGIEDVVHVVHQILEDQPVATPPTPVTSDSQSGGSNPNPPATTGSPATTPTPAAPGSLPIPNTPSPAANPLATPLPTPASTPTAAVDIKPPQSRSRIIQPINDPMVGVNLNELLDKEIAKEAGLDLNSIPTIATTEETQALVTDQIDQFKATSNPKTVSPADIPTVTVSSTGDVSTQTDPVPAEDQQNLSQDQAAQKDDSKPQPDTTPAEAKTTPKPENS